MKYKLTLLTPFQIFSSVASKYIRSSRGIIKSFLILLLCMTGLNSFASSPSIICSNDIDFDLPSALKVEIFQDNTVKIHLGAVFYYSGGFYGYDLDTFQAIADANGSLKINENTVIANSEVSPLRHGRFIHLRATLRYQNDQLQISRMHDDEDLGTEVLNCD